MSNQRNPLINSYILNVLDVKNRPKNISLQNTNQELDFFLSENNTHSKLLTLSPDGSLKFINASGAPTDATNKLYVLDGKLYWNGTELASGDITSVTAGTGLSGGGNSGAVTLSVNGATLAGTGLSNSDATLSLDASELTALGGAPASGDFIVIQDITDNSTKKVSVSNLTSTIDADITSIVAGTGLTGSSLTAGDATLNIGEGTGITVNADDIQTNDSEIVHDNLSGFVANEHIDHSTVDVTAGDGLTGGGDISSTKTLAVGQGTGITVNANDVALDTSNSRNSDHSSISITAGTGLSGGGTIASNQTLTLDLASVISGDAENKFLTSDGDGTLTAESTVSLESSGFTVSGRSFFGDAIANPVDAGAAVVTINKEDVDAADDEPIEDYSLLIARETNSNGVEVGMGFKISTQLDSDTSSVGGAITFERTDSNSKGQLHFKTKGSTGAQDIDTRMTISPEGNVDVTTHNGSSTGLKLGGTLVTATATELNYVDGVSSAIQTQLDGKLATGGNAATATNATNATNVTTATDSGNASHYLTFADSTAATQQLKTDAGITYNPNSNNLTVNNATIKHELIVNDDGGDTLVKIHDSNDDGIIDIYKNNSVVTKFHGNDESYINTGAGLCIGTTTLVPSQEKLRIMNNNGDNFNTLVVFGGDTTTEYVAVGVKSGVPTVTGGYTGTGDAPLAFQTSDDSETEQMRITAEGSVCAGDYSGNSRTWTDVTFESHWANYGSVYGDVQYRNDGFGNIHLRGLCKATNNSASVGSSNPIFILPAGYRPHHTIIMYTAASFIDSSRETTEMRIDSSGNVYLNDSSDDPETNAWVSFDGLYFCVDAD